MVQQGNIIVNMFRIPELRKKIFFTLGMLVIVRVGAYRPVGAPIFIWRIAILTTMTA